MNAKILAVIFIFINNFRICQSKKYDNYSLYYVVPSDPMHLEFLQNLNYQRYIGLIFWQKPYRLFDNVQFLVNPINKELFSERARNFKVNTHLLIPDIQKAFDNQKIQKYNKMELNSFTWEAYHSLEDIYSWLSDMASKFDIVELNSIGKSVEGREIYAVVVRKKKVPKYKVIVEGGMHGNEWISVEFVTYLLDQLTKVNEKSDWRLISMLNRYEWHLIPVMNPDGYVYSQTHDRLWRKNRKPHGNSYGVDLNRNFDYKFGKYATSNDESDDYYCGSHIFSEPESMALAKYITKLHTGLRYYFAFHSYGQKFLIPYYDKKIRSDNYAEAESLGQQAIWKIYQKHGIRYTIGSTFNMLGVRISGTSTSYVKKIHDVRFVYSILLRDNGSYGYALPPDQILPACQEMVTGLAELMIARHKRIKLQLFNGSGQLKGTMSLICLCTVFVLL